MAGPNFFIVGAPKCGTSTLHSWLSRRLDIFLPSSEGPDYWRYKEPYRYAPDIVNPPHRVENEEYAGFYQDAGDIPHRGEASAIHLFSSEAPRLISQDCPDARIIICLRHPADFIVSFWHDCLHWGHDEELNPRRAFAPDRPLSDLPARSWYPSACQYHRVAYFSGFIEHYQRYFPEEQIHFVWLHELTVDPRKAFQSILDFLGAEPLTGEFDFDAHNVAQIVYRSVLIEHALKWHLDHSALGKAVYPHLERGLHLFFRQDVAKSIPRQLLIDLRTEFDPEYQKLLEMTGRDSPAVTC